MTKQESIKYISSLINAPSAITEGDHSSIAVFRQRFPYFVPMRYLLALENHKKDPWSPAMLAAMQPYMGNWMLFCDFMEAGSGAVPLDISEPPEVQFAYREEIEIQSAGEEINDEPTEGEQEDETLAETLIADEEEQGAPAEWMAEQPAASEVIAEEQVDVVVETYYAEDTPVDEPVIVEEEVNVAEEIYLAADEPLDAPVFVETLVNADAPGEAATEVDEPEPLITPIHFQDYFLHQGERVSEDIPAEINELKQEPAGEDEDKSLMVMMSFSEWLSHFKNVSEKQKEEVKDRKALRTMWQKEKLAAAMEEENEEIPENVFEMAVNSITQEDGLVSETLADIYIKQGKYDKAIEMYRKLSLRNPQKNVYFARKIDEVLKDKQS